MNVHVGKRWEEFVDDLVKSGRYGSQSEIVREGLRLVEEREAKLAALRETIEASIDRGGNNTTTQARKAVKGRLASLSLPAERNA